MAIQGNRSTRISIKIGARWLQLMLIMAVLGLPLPGVQPAAMAQNPGGNWTDFLNISRTATASTFPCITADAAGNVHVLWSEDVGGKTKNLLSNRDGTPELDARGNQINYLYDSGNTLYYARWNGIKWLDPIDVQTTPVGRLQYPAAVVDSRGILHVVWIGTEGQNGRLYYSQAPASKAESAREWSKPTALAESVLFALYPADIATDPTGGIHIIYSQVGAESGAYAINSFDGGSTWSAPILLYNTYDGSGDEGISNVRLIADGKGRLHATWSRFGADGNGKGIYYSQSRDFGRTWSKPLAVAVWQPGWYEVDWLTVGAVGDEIHLVWEGSNNIAALNERISYDGGLTWSEPRRILSKLVGENGFSNLLIDSANQLHMLVVQRGDPNSFAHGVWYAAWEKDHWQDPILVGTPNTGLYSQLEQLSPSSLQDMMRGTLTGGGLRYQMATIVNGNQLFVVVVNEWDGDIWSSHTTLSAPYIRPRPFSQPSVPPTLPPVLNLQSAATPAPTPRNPVNATRGKEGIRAGDPILIGILPVLILVIGALVYVSTSKRWRV